MATGHAALDTQLPGGGWPVGAISEILQAQSGQSEWRLLLPALKRAASGAVVLVGAPHAPFAPGLRFQGFEARRLLRVSATTPAQRLWATEQALRCAEVVAVLAWLPQARAEQLRRLQMAAYAHGKLLFVMRPAQAQGESSPAVLRMLVASTSTGALLDALQVQILKRRGPPLAKPLVLVARHAWLGALLALSGKSDRTASTTGAGEAGGNESVANHSGRGDALDRLAAAA